MGCSPPNLEDQVICDQGFLPLAFERSVSSFKAADATLVLLRHLGRRPMGKDKPRTSFNNFSDNDITWIFQHLLYTLQID